MSNLSRLVAVVGSCAAALVGASTASAAWTAPQELPGSSGRYPLFAAYAPGGAANVGMYGPITLFPGNPQAPVAISTAGAAPVPLSRGLASPVAVSPGGIMLAVGGPRSPLDYFSVEGARSRLRAGIGPVGEPLHAVAKRGIVATRTLATAVNDRGDAAVVFSRCLGKTCTQRSVHATFRRRGDGFAKPILLARRTGYPDAAVALNPRGDAIFAWIQHRATGRGNDVRVRTRLANGTLTKVRLAGPTAPVPTIAVTLTAARRGTVSWFSQPVGEGSVGGAFVVQSAEMDSRGTLHAVNVLDRGKPTGHGEADAVHGARLRAILGADVATTYVWTGFHNGHYVVRANRLHRDVGQSEAISPPNLDAELADVATDSAGEALVVWTTRLGTAATSGVAAVIRPAGALTFGAPQLVLTGADASGTAAGAIAPGGRAIVAGGPEQVGNRDNPPGVRVTQLAG